MNISQIAKATDLLALAFVFGATVWFFFFQAPVLLKKMGREQFVPIQMLLTVTLFKSLNIALLVMLGASAVHAPLDSQTTIAAVIALVAGVINYYVVLPKAFKAGGQGRREIKGKDSEGSTAAFASEGVGDRTKWLHRLVVLFVVFMLSGVVVHGINLLGN